MIKYIIFDLDGTLIKSMENTLDLIYNELSKIEGTDMDLLRYVFTQTMGKPLKKQLQLVYKDKTDKEIDKITDYIYKKLSQQESSFFEGVTDTIRNLCKQGYKLYLSTGNSTEFAIKHLKKGGILDCFKIVLGSDKILKGPEHLEIFKEESGDDDFYKKAIYVGDGNSDREFAKQKDITFVHIGNDKKDEYEISSVVELYKILEKIN